MYTRKYLPFFVLAMLVAVTLACNLVTGKIASPTPTPSAGRSVPVTVGRQQLVIVDAREETSITGGYYPNQTTYTPNEGYTFLVVEIQYRFLDPSLDTQITSTDFSLVDEDGESQKADGGGWSGNLCVGCIFWTTSEAESGSTTVIFVIQADAIDKTWKLQHRGSEPLEFAMGDEAEFPFETEIGAFPGRLPASCDLGKFQSLGDEGRLAFKRWENDQLTLGMINADGSTVGKGCSAIAYGEIKLAKDGAAILLTGPLQGWPSLSVVEPGGKVYTLVKNSQHIEAEFTPDGENVLFTVQKLGEEGYEFYAYNRKDHATQLIEQGQWVNFRLLGEDQLLVTVTPDEGDSKTYLGKSDGSDLELLSLPKGVSSSAIQLDGTHILYTGGEYPQTTLYLAELDGSGEQELVSSSSGWGLSGALSPNGEFALVQMPKDDQNAAELVNASTGDRTLIIEPGQFTFSFSADSRWGAVLRSVNIENSEGLTTSQEHTLYIVDTSTGEVVQEISNTVNVYFSPDSSQIAYTIREGDNSPEMYLKNISDGEERSLGAGKWLGWYPALP